jgi:hypothetical protein
LEENTTNVGAEKKENRSKKQEGSPAQAGQRQRQQEKIEKKGCIATRTGRPKL